ncbi:MAG: LysR family transcriptional regulator [Spirochaetes bacterium]|nr:LysR family transcriptional regulator [Spirochaetota bacterium]
MTEDLQFLEANKYLIRYYYIYKYKSFHKASKEFYVASSDRNMKYAVQQLEKYYNVQLIKIKGNMFEFTEFGHILGEQVKKIYDININIYTMLNKLDLKEINFATSPDFYKYYIKPVFDAFIKENPEIKVNILKTNQMDSTGRLIKREIDFIVGSLPLNQNPDLIYQEIAESRIFLAYLKENRQKFNKIDSLNDIKELKGAMCDHTHIFYHNVKEIEKENNIKLNIVHNISDFESLIDAVRSRNVDYSIVGNYEFLDEDVNFYDITGFFKPHKICYIYRKNEALTKSIEKLIIIAEKLKIKPV